MIKKINCLPTFVLLIFIYVQTDITISDEFFPFSTIKLELKASNLV